jgi:nucleoside-diphosphate-sugar epimerase
LKVETRAALQGKTKVVMGPLRPARSLLLLLLLLSAAASGLSSPKAAPRKVLVTGASGRTGALVLERLLDDPRFEPRALVRSESSGKTLRKLTKVGLDQIVVCDVTSLTTANDAPHEIEGCESMIICTSACPAVSKRSLLLALLKAPFNLIRGKKPVDFRSLRFVWKYKGYPELVDYHGQIAQIELAKRTKMKQVIIVSSMGGTDPSNFLNSVGKNADGTGNGDILLWKRKAERYLVESGVDYAIIHPGGLVDTPAGQRELWLDVDDKLLSNNPRSIPRGDVANLCIAALTVGKGRKIAFDCITRPPIASGDDSSVPIRSAEEALEEFLREGKSYNYAL